LEPQPFPSPLEMLTHADEGVRARGARLMADAPQPQHLLAFALAVELHDELARGGLESSRSLLGSWEALGKLRVEGPPQEEWLRLSSYPADRAQWAREHAEAVAPQELTPALAAVRDAGAAAVAARYPTRLELPAEVAAAAAEAEAALVARAP